MAVAILNPNDRYAIIGKTGSGKTGMTIVLAYEFARSLHAPWEVWWMDTKGDPDDLKLLRKFGAVNGASESDTKRVGGLRNFKYFRIIPTGNLDTVDLAQAKMAEAYERGHVIVVVDEYTQVIVTSKNEGYALQDIFARGRGKKVGLIGLTQEPVNVPRKLISQASHIGLFNLTYPRDIKYVKEFCKDYVLPREQGDDYGFYWSHIDGSAQWAYYQNQKEWADALEFSIPKPLSEAASSG